MTKLAPRATKCIFLGYRIDGEFGYRVWNPENRKLIRNNNVVFNEDSILFRNKQEIVGKKVSFEIDKDAVEGLAHQTKLTLRQIAEENKVPTES